MVVMNYVLTIHELKLDGGNELCYVTWSTRLTIQLKLDGGNELCSYVKVIHRLTIQLKLDGGNELMFLC